MSSLLQTFAPMSSPNAATTRALRDGLSRGHICPHIDLSIFHPDNSTCPSVT